MSRYEFVNKSLELAVGWDQGLQTFFARLVDTNMPEGEDEILWVGTSPKELPTVEALKDCLTDFWILDEETCRDLSQDRETQAPLSPLQRTMLHWLSTESTPELDIPHSHLCPRCVRANHPLPAVLCFGHCIAEDARLCSRHRRQEGAQP